MLNNDKYRKLENKKSNDYGKYYVFLKIKKTYLIAIGPHWYISLIGYGILVFIFTAIYLFLEKYLNPIIKNIFIFLFLIKTIIFFLIFFLNPGIVKKKKKIINSKKEIIYNCYRCYTKFGENSQHCEDCEICIKGLDHHCQWMGKCIADRNLILFYLYLLMICLFFLYVIFMVLILSYKLD